MAMCSSLLSLLLLTSLAALVFGSSPLEAANDTTALLQAPGQWQLDRPHSAFEARIVRNGLEPKRRALVAPKKAVHETRAACSEVLGIVEAHGGISSGSAFWRYVCQEDVRGRLMEMKGGCLYLPGSEHVEVFYQKVDRINSWHIVDMLENSFFPFEGGRCPTDERDKAVNSTEGAVYRTCANERGFVGAKGECIRVKHVASTPASENNLAIYELDGMMGVDPVWASMMSEAGDDAAEREALLAERSSKAIVTTKASRNQLTTITVWAVVCDPGDGSVNGTVADTQILEQIAKLDQHFGGADTCAPPLTYSPPFEDTGFRFELETIERVTNPLCGGPNDCANHVTQLTSQVVPVLEGKVKILICDTSLLGRASFPGYPDSQRILLINKDSLPQGSITRYNEGDTCTHEMGHYLGLYHTFQGGCKRRSGGDLVADTDSERSPNYGCPSAPVFTCSRRGGAPDPVHNFMDYSDGRCMCSFTQGQKDRMYQQLQLYDPHLLR